MRLRPIGVVALLLLPLMSLVGGSSVRAAPIGRSGVTQAASPMPFIRISGIRTAGLTFPSVAAAGDVNGDGVPDLLVGATGADNNRRNDSGSAYVVFGQRVPTDVALTTLGTHGFRIDGASAGDQA